jgi:glycosyltransferase involved in cell wall biosynthesis
VTAPELLGSVVIPAHNEAAVIRRCLDTLLAGFQPTDLDVVVACNGCTDDTADIVRSSGYPVRVLEVETASKSTALRAAEEVVTAFPRLYVDADVVLTASSARLVLDRLRTGPALAARPPLLYDTDRSGLLVRSYYRARTKVPAVMNSLWGAGVYGLSEAGRARFGVYPDVVADDFFMDQHFRRSEIEIVNCEPVVVTAPHTTADLLRILRRYYWANTQSHPISTQPATSRTLPATLRGLARLASTEPARAADTAIYVMLAGLTRLTVVVTAPKVWGRDNSSRSRLG